MSSVPALRLPAVVVFVLALLLALPAAASSPEEERLAETRAKLDALQTEISGTSEELAERQASLQHAEEKVEEVLAAVEEAELAVQRQQQAVAAAQAKLGQLRRQANRQRAVTRDRAVELYKQGTGAPLVAVLSSSSTREVLDRSSLIEAVSESDARSFERVSAAQVAVDAQRDVLKDEEAALSRVYEQQRQLLAQVDAIRQEKAIAASDSAARLDSLQAQEADLEEESARLAALARRAAAAPPPAPAAPAGPSAPEPASPDPAAPAPAPAPVSGGGWVWPASGPLTSGFGYRWGRMHQGIDIGSPTGAPTVAARSGTVIYAGSMGGYGNMVLVDHGDGIVTAYAHHTSILVGVGQGVGAGQQLGTVGSSGNVTGPHLHFEVRVGGAARDPLGYLP